MGSIKIAGIAGSAVAWVLWRMVAPRSRPAGDTSTFEPENMKDSRNLTGAVEEKTVVGAIRRSRSKRHGAAVP